MNLVPNDASEIEESPDFSLVATTSSGIKIYIRKLSQPEADSIVIGSRDDSFLSYQEDLQFLMVSIRGGRILRTEPKPRGDLEPDDVLDQLAVLAEHGG